MSVSRLLVKGVTIGVIASVLVCSTAILFRSQVTPPPEGMNGGPALTAIQCLCGWDGEWYAHIVSNGYYYIPGQQSSVVFFPAFPVVGKLVARTFRISPELALVLLANVSFILAVVVYGQYVYRRRSPANDAEAVAMASMILLSVFPTSCFFHMGYSESLFFLVSVLVLYGLTNPWPTTVVALLIGFATAIRPVGVGLVPPLMWEMHRRGLLIHRRQTQVSKRRWLHYANLPLACWGIVAYMAFQRVRFGDAFGFVKGQAEWHNREPAADFAAGFVALITGEPMRVNYQSCSTCYWGTIAPFTDPLFNIRFANPIYVLFVASLCVIGLRKRWINSTEAVMAAGLLLIPYVTQAYRMCMQSQGRFAAVVPPTYMVLAIIATKCPKPVTVFLAACFSILLIGYACLFVRGYEIL